MNITVKFFVILSVMVTVSSAGILDTLFSWGLAETEARSTTPPSKCLCQTSGCLCCVDLNLTSAIDLGGPTCLNIKQKEENVTLNMSFGENAMHNATIKIAEAANQKTCMDLLSDLAQICAKFTSVKEAQGSPGHEGCLVVEPALLGTTQAVYPIGCFNFNQGIIRQLDTAVPEVTEPVEAVAEGGEEDEDKINTDEIIAAVSASAEKGIALFSQWLGLTLNQELNETSSADDNGDDQSRRLLSPPLSPPESSSRTSRKLDNFNVDKSEERFKQILSAQDNIQKESPRIGQAVDVETTYVFTEPPPSPGQMVPENVAKSEKINMESQATTLQGNLAVVPRESRRGGRAYNIHQHVNEI